MPFKVKEMFMLTNQPDPYPAYLTTFRQALDDEIAAAQASGGRGAFISDGHYLGKRENLAIYSFTADAELRFPDGSFVKVTYHDQECEGQIISIDGFDLVIALDQSYGDQIPTATLSASPWMLLRELQRRLEEMAGQRQPLVEQVVLNTGTQRVPDIKQATDLLDRAVVHDNALLNANIHQRQAIAQILTNHISFVWGPPGTGKTKTLGMTVAALVESGQSVLVVAHSNVAVDVAMLSVAQYLHHSPTYRTGSILRYGVPALADLDRFPLLYVKGVLREKHRTFIERLEALDAERRRLTKLSRDPELEVGKREAIKDALAKVKQDLGPLQTELREKERELLSWASVVGCTLSKAALAPEIYQRQFDAVLLDEASMAYIPQCVFVTNLAKQRVAFFGDFRQLPPVSQADTDYARRWLQRDIFDHAGLIERVQRNQRDPRLVLLATQYRMHPEISATINQLFYAGLLRDGPAVEQATTPIVRRNPNKGHALALYDLKLLSAFCLSEHEAFSRFNPVSALVAVHLAHHLLQKGNLRVGIITPYNAQSRLIRRLVQDVGLPGERVPVATVHRFQGSECDAVIFDIVEGPPKTKAGRLIVGGTQSTAMRLANVAISRARGKFIGLVHHAYLHEQLAPADSFRQLIDHIATRIKPKLVGWPDRAAPYWEGTFQNWAYYRTAEEARIDLEQSLLNAQEEIAVVWPDVSLPLAKQRLTGSHVGVRLFVAGPRREQLGSGLRNSYIWDGQAKPTVGLIGIDRKQLWIFLVPHNTDGPVLRFDWPQTVKLLYAFLRLVPDREVKRSTLSERLEEGQSPVGLPCEQCGQPMWPDTGRYGAYMVCTARCGFKRRLGIEDATALARMMNVVCEECGGQVIGRKGYKGVLLGCVRYPACSWMKAIEQVI